MGLQYKQGFISTDLTGWSLFQGSSKEVIKIAKNWKTVHTVREFLVTSYSSKTFAKLCSFLGFVCYNFKRRT